MMDAALLEKKLAFIETCLRELRELRELAVLDRLGSDVREPGCDPSAGSLGELGDLCER